MRVLPFVAIALAGCGGSDLPSDQPYVLFAPVRSNTTYLMDLKGQLVHEWHAASSPACSVSLLKNGLLLRPRSLGQGSFTGGGCNGGRVELIDWDGRVTWSFDYFGPDHQQHHDVKWMPNGHVLMIAWETRTAAEALAAGRRPDTIPESGVIWVDHVVEVDPSTNAIVWVWRVWDHLVPPGGDPSAHPELIDPNAGAQPESDWTHSNAIDYNPDLDQIILSVRNLSEIWVLDHGTTTAEAAGHTGGRRGRGGDLLYRWGNRANYGRPGNRELFGQHNAHWIEAGLPDAGQVLIFDNGDRTARPYSTVVELAAPALSDGTYAFDPSIGFLPADPEWRFVASPPTSLFANIVSGAQRLRSGNTLVCDGPGGRFLEVTREGEVVWSYVLTDTAGDAGILVFRATRYEPGYLGVAGRMLSPQGPIRVELTPVGLGRANPPV